MSSSRLPFRHGFFHNRLPDMTRIYENDIISSQVLPFSDNQEYVDTMLAWVPRLAYNPIEIKTQELEEKTTSIHPSYDCFRLFDTLAPPTSYLQEEPLNLIGSSQIPDGFRSGVLSPDFLCPVNQRGHMKNLTDNFSSIGFTHGYNFSKSSNVQCLQVLRDRYLKKRKDIPITPPSNVLAQDMVDEFFREHINLKPFPEEKIQGILEEFIVASKQKNYEPQFVGYDNPDARIIRFHLKDINKPKSFIAVPDTTKAGQGISAWSKDVQVMFGAAMRVINQHLLDCLKENAVYDNKYTKQTLKKKILQALKLVSEAADVGVTDYKTFDAMQDLLTQLIEKKFLFKLGVSQEFIDLYYSFREHYIIIANEIFGKSGPEKTSGEPGTLLLNSILAAVMTNFVLRGDGPAVIAMKGDDGFKYQVNLHVDFERLRRVEVYTNLRIHKLELGKTAEFCGFTIVNGQFFENLPRKMNKILGHKFRSYSHFTEVQASYRDFLKDVLADGETETVAANAYLYNVDYLEMRYVYDFISSMAHIDENQYKEITKQRSISPVINTPKGVLPV